MARDPGYPNNLLKQDRLNSLFGGEQGNAFGLPAWLFLNGWVRDLADWFLTHIRVSWSTQVIVTQEAVVAGDVLGMSVLQSAPDGGPYVARLASIPLIERLAIGLAAEPAAAGSRVLMISGGVVPAAITGLGSIPSTDVRVSADLNTGRLKAWAPGEEVLGYTDRRGNVLLLAPARAV
jgi:hypothetical protein